MDQRFDRFVGNFWMIWPPSITMYLYTSCRSLERSWMTKVITGNI
jgi:hypothetical protein